MNATQLNPAPAPRASKEDRLRYLRGWALENPFATIEEARLALKERFDGIAVGTKAISDSLRESRRLAEARLKGQPTPPAPPGPAAEEPEPGRGLLQQKIAVWKREMVEYGIRLVAINPDGSVRVEFAAA